MPVTWIAIRLGKTRVHAGAASTDPHVEQHRNARAATWRALRSLVSGEGLASAAAGGGEPAPLLTRYAYGLSIDPSRPPALRHEVGEDNHRRYGMPVTRIAIRQGRSREFKQALMDEIYEAMRETIHIKDGDRFMTITEHGASEFAYGSFLDIERTDDLVQSPDLLGTRQDRRRQAGDVQGDRPTTRRKPRSAARGHLDLRRGDQCGELVIRERRRAVLRRPTR